jgi:TRAP-type C4-dicarboxylate transport system substrate-binding protein
LALSLPSLIRNDAEFDAVMASVEPLIRAKLSEHYAVLVLAKGGWVRYFSKKPLVYPEDLEGLRMSVNPNDDKVMRLLQSAGARTVKGDMSSLLLQLNSNAVDAFYLSPVFVASLWSQYKGKVNYMSPFRVSPFIGAIVFNRSSWDRVPAALKPRLEEAARAIVKRMTEESNLLEDDAVASMLKDGLQTSPYPKDADARWNAVYAQRRNGLVASMFSKDMLDTIDAALAKVRGGK